MMRKNDNSVTAASLTDKKVTGKTVRKRRKRGKVKMDAVKVDNLINKKADMPCDISKVNKNFKPLDDNASQLKSEIKSAPAVKQTGKANLNSWLDGFDDDDEASFEMQFDDANGNKKKNNTEVSWLDFSSDDEDQDYSLDSTNQSLHFLSEQSNIQNQNLNAYRQRFYNRIPQASTSSNDLPQSWNNERVVSVDLNSKIGVNVNDLNRAGPKKDSTKRSRRKTEPFDFKLQADGDINDVLEDSNEVKVPNATSWDIPGGLCSFMAESNENDSATRDLDGRNLLSGSISGKGLFIPFKDFEGRLSRENSLEKIFDESYDDDLEQLMADTCVASSDDNSDSEDDDDKTCENPFGVLPPEPQLGNVEYKLKLVNPTKQRFEHLVTQMKWRLREGQGEALYEIGVRDCGRVRGLSPSEMRASLLTLRRMATRLGAACTLIGHRRLVDSRRALAEVLVRKIPDDQHNIEVRVAVMGSNDAGKSTLVGVLTQGELDNGRGSARLNMFRHLHEVKTGRTSSVSHEILGFDSQGRPINYASNELMTSEEINEQSSKLVSFIDLAGHRKYLKTTVQGLTGYSPHYAMLVVSATAGINQMTLEHLALLVALDLPFFVVVTKIDVTSYCQILKQLEDELKAIGCRKVPMSVLTMNDAVTAGSNAPFRFAVPILPVSSVTGKGLEVLRWFLFILPPVTTPNKYEQEPVEFQIDEIFKIGDANGPVVGGLLKKGVLTEKTKLLIGPLDSGDFVTVHVNSLHRNKVPCRVVRAGQAASLGLSWLPPGLRQGMFLLAIPTDYVQNEEPFNILQSKDKGLRLKQITNLTIKSKISPKYKRKNKQRFISDDKNNLNKIDKDDCNKQQSKPIDDNDKENHANIVRLTASQYSNRYTNIFENDAAELGESSKSDDAKDSTSSEDETSINKFNCIDSVNPEGLCEDTILEEDPNNPRGCYFFQASVMLLNHSAPVYPGSQCTVHIGNIRQTAVVEGILSSDRALRANEEAPILFRFMRHPEYVRTGVRILFREALHTKGVGRVTQVFPHKSFDSYLCTKHSP